MIQNWVNVRVVIEGYCWTQEEPWIKDVCLPVVYEHLKGSLTAPVRKEISVFHKLKQKPYKEQIATETLHA